MLSSWWRTIVMKRMTRAYRVGRTQLRAETLEARDTPAGIFASAVSPGNPPVVAVFDAVTKQQKFTVNAFDATFTGGVNVAVGDVNGDGTADLITGAGPGGGSAVHVFSGVDGSLLKSFTVGDDASRAGVSVAAADFDGDGRVEIVAGGSLNGQPIVQVLRVSDGTAIQTFTPFAGVQGVSVAAGDVNGDGTPDVVAGAGPGGAPVVAVFNGKDGSTILSQQVFETSFSGGVTVSAADLNGDKNADVIVSARALGGPRVTVLAGPTGAVIQNFFADSATLRNGVEAVGFDADANGRLDLVTTSAAGLKAFDGLNLATLTAPTTPGLPVAAVYDTTAPTATVTTTAANPTKTSPIPFRVVFSKAVNGFSAAGLTATNGTTSNFVAVDAKTYTLDVTPTAAGAVTVSVTANTAFDAAGNGNATASGSATFDSGGPKVTIVSQTTNKTTPTITGAVDDPAATVVVSVNGQTVNATVDSTGNYSATLSTPLAPGTYAVTATATDKLGKTGTATAPTGLVIDTTAPTPTVSSTAPEPTKTSPIPFKVTFDKDVTGFDASRPTVTNGSVTANSFTRVDAKTYTFTVTAAGQGAVTVSVAAGVATDTAGNPSLASNVLTRTLDTVAPTVSSDSLTTSNNTPTITGTVSDPTASVSVTIAGNTMAAHVSGTTWSLAITSALADGPYDIVATATDPAGNTSTNRRVAGLVIDTTRPNVTVTTTSPNPTNAATIPIRIDFTEVMTGFTVPDITVGNGQASNFVSQGDNRTFTADITPTTDGPVTVSVAANVAQDPVQLGNNPSNTITITSDRTAPKPTVTSSEPNPTAAATIPIQVSFGEPVTGFTLSGVTVTNGTASNLAGSGADYTFDVVPTPNSLVTVSIAAGAAQDAAGNQSTQATFTITTDTTNPVATVSSGAAPATNVAPIPFTVTFSKPVTGFALTGLTVMNGTPSGLSGSGTTYTFDVAPGAQGDVSVSVNANAVVDGGGHSNPASSPFAVTFDSTAPAAAVSTTATDPTNLSLIPFTVSFGEPVTGFTLAGITVNNGTASNLAGAGATYTFDVHPAADGLVTVTIGAGAAHDAAGNQSTSGSTSITSDTTVPTASITSTESSPTPAAVIPIKVTFSEVVTGFALSGVTVTNGTASNLTGSGTTYTFGVTPAANGPIMVTVGAGAAHDAAGNLSSQATFSIISEIPPSATITPGVTGPTNTSPIPFTVTFSEPVTGFSLSGITVNNGIASKLAGSGTTYTFDVTPAKDGPVMVTVNAGAAQDAAGNPSLAASTSVTFDQTAPDGTINPTSTGTITGTASDATAGVQKVEVMISNGTSFWSGSAFDSPTPVPLLATGTANWSYHFTGPAGTYRVTIKVTDNAGNLGGNFAGTPVDVTVGP
jgi:hypothetical protein